MNSSDIEAGRQSASGNDQCSETGHTHAVHDWSLFHTKENKITKLLDYPKAKEPD